MNHELGFFPFDPQLMDDRNQSLNEEIRFLSKLLETPGQGKPVDIDEDLSGWFLSRQLPEV